MTNKYNKEIDESTEEQETENSEQNGDKQVNIENIEVNFDEVLGDGATDHPENHPGH